ncbi:MAG: hypothetical protein ACKVPX_13570 [Myxococcaceae bacterium]
MKNRGTILFALLLSLSGVARAQIVSSGGSSPQDLQIQFNGIISTTVMINVSGAGPTTLTGTTTALQPTRAVGTIDLGTFNSVLPGSSVNCDAYRASSGTPGAILAASMLATVTYNGSTTASVTVMRRNPVGALPDIPLANLRVSSPGLPAWSTGTDGTAVPSSAGPGLDICTLAGDPTCVNGVGYLHQLAVFVPDTQLSGPFSTTVLYTATSP